MKIQIFSLEIQFSVDKNSNFPDKNSILSQSRSILIKKHDQIYKFNQTSHQVICVCVNNKFDISIQIHSISFVSCDSSHI